MPTIFTKIINREIPASIIYEDDVVLAFLDISQATKGHTLVVPKVACENIFDIPEDVLKHLIGVAKMLSTTLVKVFNAKGINLLNNNGVTAGQSVFHYHFHLIPRYDESDLTITLPSNQVTGDELKERAALIQAALL